MIRSSADVFYEEPFADALGKNAMRPKATKYDLRGLSTVDGEHQKSVSKDRALIQKVWSSQLRFSDLCKPCIEGLWAFATTCLPFAKAFIISSNCYHIHLGLGSVTRTEVGRLHQIQQKTAMASAIWLEATCAMQGLDHLQLIKHFVLLPKQVLVQKGAYYSPGLPMG